MCLCVYFVGVHWHVWHVCVCVCVCVCVHAYMHVCISRGGGGGGGGGCVYACVTLPHSRTCSVLLGFALR